MTAAERAAVDQAMRASPLDLCSDLEIERPKLLAMLGAVPLTVLKDRVRELRPMFVGPDPASRTVYQAGELAPCDLWFPTVDIDLGHGPAGRPPALVMVCGYSRNLDAVLLPSRQGPGPAHRALGVA